MSDSKKSLGGRPERYRKEFAELAYNYCLLGATDKQLAEFFEVTDRTINRWKKSHPEFCQSLKSGKVIADAQVAQSLYKRATGYEQDEDKIFQYEGLPVIVPTKKHYSPDPASMIFWLKNRQPELWRANPVENGVQDREIQRIEIEVVGANSTH